MDGQFWCSSLHKYLQWCQDIHIKKLGTVSPQKQIIQWKDNLFESLVWLVPSTSLLTSYPEILPPDLCIACVHKACWRGGMWPEILVRQAMYVGLFVQYTQSTDSYKGGMVRGNLTLPLPPHLSTYTIFACASELIFNQSVKIMWIKNKEYLSLLCYLLAWLHRGMV